MFFADVLGGYNIYNGLGTSMRKFLLPLNSHQRFAIQHHSNGVTESIGFGVTASTTYDSPYAMARKSSTVDHLDNGRIAWNIVTPYLDSTARNFGLDAQVEHDKRYEIALEYLDVISNYWKNHGDAMPI